MEPGPAASKSERRTRRVFVVDDSQTARHALCAALESSGSGLQVVGAAARGDDALLRIARIKPDIVIADLLLGREGGLALAARIMESCATPVVVMTGADTRDPTLAARAMRAGALDVLAKPPGPQHPAYAEACDKLRHRLRTLSEVKVVTRRKLTSEAAAPAFALARPAQAPKLWLIGASTGGPAVLESLLAALPRPFPLPIAIVQHLGGGFAPGLAQWLSRATGHRLVVCERREVLTPGVVYLAPDARHLRLVDAQTLEPYDAPPRDHQRPSVDLLFESAARHLGRAAGAIVLTGMGRDGALGAAALRRCGSLVLAQDPATCAIDSMPRAARDVGGVQRLLPPHEIAALLASMAPQG